MLTPHLPFSWLADFAEGTREPDAMSRAHLAACPTCTADLAWLSHTIGTLREASVAEPPTLLVAAERAKALFRQRRAAPPSHRIVRARLRFDSQRAAPAYGLRAGGSYARQLLLDADGAQIDLRVAPAADGWQISGQILGHGAHGGGRAELLGGRAAASAELSELHEFALPPVREGRYNLTLSLDDSTIVIADLALGE